MKEEILTVNTDKHNTIRYLNEYSELHHPYGPAVIRANGDKYHYINDQLHNSHGPAVIRANGSKEYWINNREITESEFTARQA